MSLSHAEGDDASLRDRQVDDNEQASRLAVPVGFPEALKVLRPYWKPLAIALLIGTAAVAVGAIQPLVVSNIVDSFDGGLPPMEASLLVILLIFGACLTAVRELVIERTGEKYAFDTRNRLVRHIYALPISRLERRERGDLVSRVTTDVSETRNFLTSGFVDLAVSCLTVVVSLVMMAIIDGLLLLLSVVSVALVLVAVLAIGKRTRPVGLEMQNALGSLAESVSRALGSMRTIRATRATERESERASMRAGQVLRAGLLAARLRALLQTVSGVSIQILLIVVVGVGALRVAAGHLTTGELSAFIMYLMMMASPVAMVGGIIASLGEAFGSLSRILEIESESVERDLVRGSNERDSVQSAGVISFEDISFYYPDTNRSNGDSPQWALREVSFSISAGETVAFVGPSGAGKSTVFALIERFYDPTSGRIRFEGTDVLDLSRDELRRQLAYVDQEAMVLQGTVRDNLLLAAPGASDGACLNVLRQVNLIGEVDAGAGGTYLDLDVGEQGRGFSGGERQRLAIARSLLAGASILLLDEATSSLDSRNEALIQDAIAPPEAERTTLVIAHRFSTVVSADRIIVMEGGKIVAQGRHLELLQTSPLYRELAHRQLLSDTDAASPSGPPVDRTLDEVDQREHSADESSWAEVDR